MSVGAQLRQARQARKGSFADVTKATKIQPWVLEALEADRLQELMSPIYVKGFLTTYAKFLRLDPDALAAQLHWPQPEPEPEPLPPASAPSWQVSLRVPPRVRRRLGMALAVSGALLGLIVINPLRWMPSTIRLASAPAPEPPAPSGPKLASVTPVQESLKPPPAPSLASLTAGPLELAVKAHRTTWIRVRADGKLLTQQRLPRGAHERWIAKDRFEVIVSQPTQVELTLNGQPISPFAVAHQGRMLITRRGVSELPTD